MLFNPLSDNDHEEVSEKSDFTSILGVGKQMLTTRHQPEYDNLQLNLNSNLKTLFFKVIQRKYIAQD